MSAVATTVEYTPATPALEVVVPSSAQLAEQEMYRWMLWFGLPSLVAAIFVAIVFATGSMWWIGGGAGCRRREAGLAQLLAPRGCDQVGRPGIAELDVHRRVGAERLELRHECIAHRLERRAAEERRRQGDVHAGPVDVHVADDA